MFLGNFLQFKFFVFVFIYNFFTLTLMGKMFAENAFNKSKYNFEGI